MSSNINLPRSFEDNYHEIYEKLRPLEEQNTNMPEHQAHGDDTRIQPSKDLDRSFAYEKTAIPPMSSSSNEFSFEMAMRITDTSNEALKTDDENGMTKSYFLSDYHQREKEIIFSDVSLQPLNECDYEIDLGNGYITKSTSSYQNRQRTVSVLSADSIQPITTFKMPFTSTVYKAQIHPKENMLIDDSNQTNALFNAQQRASKFSFRTITSFSIGTTILLFLVVILFFVL